MASVLAAAQGGQDEALLLAADSLGPVAAVVFWVALAAILIVGPVRMYVRGRTRSAPRRRPGDNSASSGGGHIPYGGPSDSSRSEGEGGFFHGLFGGDSGSGSDGGSGGGDGGGGGGGA